MNSVPASPSACQLARPSANNLTVPVSYSGPASGATGRIRATTPSDTAETAPTQRDRHLQLLAEKGRMGWQKASGYNRRARIEATMGRFKGMIGDGLRSRMDQRRATEVGVAVHALNRMLELGRPESVRIA